MAPSFSKLVDATLGIDIGSTSTRACLWIPSRKQAIHVENTVEKTSGHFLLPGDYDSAGFPFEPYGPVYLEGDSDPNRRETSLKFGFYALAKVKDVDLLEQYHLVQPLMEKKDDPRFCARLRQGLVELLTAVERDVQSNCRIKGLRVTRIGLSIPAQWTLEFEDVYREIAMRVFAHIGEDIGENMFFHTETEALAHFLLHTTPQEFQVLESEDYRVFLFLDFGGHNMNGCIFNLVQRDQNESPSFYRIGDAFGAGGGSEHWTYNIGKRVLQEMRNIPGISLSLQEERGILETFNNKKRSLGPSRAQASLPFSFGPCSVIMSVEDITECFEKGHKNVFEKAKCEIEHVSQYKVVPQVVVSGGTAKHFDIQRRLRDFCNVAMIPEPWFVNEISLNYSSGKIAHGVAMAASNCLTIPEFMARGAAFGLQIRECANRGNANPNKLWNDVGHFLLNQNEQVTFRFHSGGNDEYKIICDPFFEGHPSEELHFDRCYDILDLGKSMAGFRSIKLSLVTDNGLTSLVIETRRDWNGGHKKRRKGHSKLQDHNHVNVKKSPPLKMYFDGGTNCAHVDLNEFDLREIDFGIKRDNECVEEVVASTDVQPNGGTSSCSQRGEVTQSTSRPNKPLVSAISTGSAPLDAI